MFFQLYDCFFATDDHIPTEESEKDAFKGVSISEGGPLHGVASSEHAVPFPWLELELAQETPELKYVVIDFRQFKSYR